jgi:coiled-coil domain-containing protein 12
MSETTVGRLEDEALKRKERLHALKRGESITIKNNSNENISSSQSFEDEKEKDYLLKPLFRNYTPVNDQLKSSVLSKPSLIEIEAEIKDQLESAKPKPLIEKEIDLNNLAPQKVDWDLKRDLGKVNKLLEKKTQQSIIEIIRERLKQNDNLAELVQAGSKVSMNNSTYYKNENDSSEEESIEKKTSNIEPKDNEESNIYTNNLNYNKSIDDISDDDDY